SPPLPSSNYLLPRLADRRLASNTRPYNLLYSSHTLSLTLDDPGLTSTYKVHPTLLQRYTQPRHKGTPNRATKVHPTTPQRCTLPRYEGTPNPATKVHPTPLQRYTQPRYKGTPNPATKVHPTTLQRYTQPRYKGQYTSIFI
ncbi:hypothetical protein OTU49_003660, partial [Cherax quadricarinatus]